MVNVFSRWLIVAIICMMCVCLMEQRIIDRQSQQKTTIIIHHHKKQLKTEETTSKQKEHNRIVGTPNSIRGDIISTQSIPLNKPFQKFSHLRGDVKLYISFHFTSQNHRCKYRSQIFNYRLQNMESRPFTISISLKQRKCASG